MGRKSKSTSIVEVVMVLAIWIFIGLFEPRAFFALLTILGIIVALLIVVMIYLAIKVGVQMLKEKLSKKDEDMSGGENENAKN